MSAFDVRNPGLHDLIAADAPIERIAGGLVFTEGPVWRGDALLFSDIPNNRIARWRRLPEGPELTTFATGPSNGLTLDRQGRVLAAEHGGRRVARVADNGERTVLVDRFEGKRLNSPNDIVVKADGSIYFTDPPYAVHTVAPGIALPNGLAFSPDESILYINDSARQHIRAFDVGADGRLTNSRVLLDMASQDPGVPDGMKVDLKGNVFCTGAGGVWVCRSDGTLLGRILLPELPANLGWGEDGSVLFMTARTSVYRIKTKTRGALPG
jgi:gluconolactonase